MQTCLRKQRMHNLINQNYLSYGFKYLYKYNILFACTL